MPRNEKVVVVLVASPADVESERNRLEDVVRELNLTWRRTFGLSLELVRWETHGYPALGIDPQDVLNQEMPGDYDIFVGLMWSRYGTPTGRAGSGTEEEFNRALARHRQSPDSVQIMFYFKDAPLNPSSIVPEQLTKVQRFKASLGPEGALYWSFGTTEEFEQLLRLHLARQIQKFYGSLPLATRETERVDGAAASEAEEEDDDLGLLDILDLMDEHFETLNGITARISTETNSLGQRLNERTVEIEAAIAQAQGALGRPQAKILIAKAAQDMTQFVARMRAEIPLFREMLRNAADWVGRAALMSASSTDVDRRQVVDARAALVKFLYALVGAHESVLGFQGSVHSLPRMTSVMNKAKRETSTVLQDVLDGLDEGRRVSTETIRALDALLGGGELEG